VVFDFRGKDTKGTGMSVSSSR